MSNKPRLLKSKKDKEQFIFWIETLRAEILPKGKDELKTVDDCYCCLGVGMACITDLQFGRSFPGGGFPSWIHSIITHSRRYYDFNIMAANDGYYTKELTHPQIADKLWELYKWELE